MQNSTFNKQRSYNHHNLYFSDNLINQYTYFNWDFQKMLTTLLNQ